MLDSGSTITLLGLQAVGGIILMQVARQPVGRVSILDTYHKQPDLRHTCRPVGVLDIWGEVLLLLPCLMRFYRLWKILRCQIFRLKF